MYLIFDTETTGLPKKWNAPLTDSDNWPRCVQISWQIHDQGGGLISNRDYLINQMDLKFRMILKKYMVFLLNLPLNKVKR